MIVTNGSSFDKNLTNSDAQKLKDKDQPKAKQDTAKEKKAVKEDGKDQKVDSAPAAETAAKPATKAAAPKKKDGGSAAKESREQTPKLSIDTKREQVKAMLEQSVATPKVELEVVEEEIAGDEAKKLEQQVSSPQMLQTPRKDLDRNMSPDKVSDKVSTTQMSPFKTPCKGPDDKSATKEGRHSFLQSFNSDQMSLRKSLIENPYSSFISL